MIIFIIVFIIFIICQLLAVKYLNFIPNNIIKEYNEYNINLNNNIISILKERVDLLKNNKLEYKDWIEYNNKNKNLYINENDSLYINIFENINNTQNFIIRVYDNDEHNNQLLNTFINNINNNKLYFLNQNIDINIIYNMFKSYIYDKDYNSLNFNWIDIKNNFLLYKKGIYIKYKSKEGIEGVILISYTIKNLTNILKKKKIYYIRPWVLFLSYFILFSITVLIYILDSNILVRFKAYLILIIINIYFFIYFNSFDIEYKAVYENNKITIFTRYLQSISFLIGGVNIYILTSLNYKKKNKRLKLESIILFCFSLLLLLLTIFRDDSIFIENELIKHRISINFLFNFSILLTIIIVLNFLFFNIKL